MLKALGEKRLIVPTIMTVAALPFLVFLGSWQMARKDWKEGILHALSERASAPVISDAETRKLECRPSDEAGSVTSCEYKRVKLRGAFDHSAEKHIFAGVQRTNQGPMPGYWILTPFKLAQTGTESDGAGVKPAAILVNRGFVPEPLKPAESRAKGQVMGEVEIIAHIRTRELRRWADAPNDVEKNVYFVRDPEELLGGADGVRPAGTARLFDGVTYYLELVDGAPGGGFPLPLAGHVELPNRHLEYALTWFGLAGALLAIYLAYAIPRLRAAPGA